MINCVHYWAQVILDHSWYLYLYYLASSLQHFENKYTRNPHSLIFPLYFVQRLFNKLQQLNTTQR